MRIFIAAMLLVFGLSGQVKAAGYLSGNTLYEWCQAEGQKGGACTGYVVGVRYKMDFPELTGTRTQIDGI